MLRDGRPGLHAGSGKGGSSARRAAMANVPGNPVSRPRQWNRWPMLRSAAQNTDNPVMRVKRCSA